MLKQKLQLARHADIVMDGTRGKTPQIQFADLTKTITQLEEGLALYLPQIFICSTPPILDIGLFTLLPPLK
jgi:hypothetical protein